MEAIVVFPIFILIFVAVLFIGHHQTKKNAAIWSSVAEELGLYHHRPSNWSIGMISGDYKGYNVQIETFSRGSGKNRTTYTRIETMVRGTLPGGLKIYYETPVFSSLGKFFGGQDILTGDKAFDDLFIIKGADENAVLNILNNKTRSALLDYHNSVGKFDLDAQRLSYVTRGVLTDAFEMKRVVMAQNNAMDTITRQHQNLIAGV